ncbi:MAG TPA: GNAT family N-acetyltransferase [Acidimicrobiia bacterium]|nr:GNAT family N-acetyltransferase [Acidimicrobiia bacterium]
MSSIKVAHLTTVDLSLRYLVFSQLLAIKAAGGEAVGISAPGPWVSELEAAGIRHIPLVASTRGMDLLADLKAARDLWKVLKREKFDVLHTHNPKPGIYGRILGRLAGVPVVVNTVHGLYATRNDNWLKRAVVYLLEAIASRFSHAELVQSREDFEFIRRWRISPRRRTFFLGNGIDLTRFDSERISKQDRAETRADLGAQEETVIVGIVGRLVAEKGYPELFEAARRLDDRYLVVCVGPADPEKKDGLPDHVVQRAAEAGVRFLGMRDDVERLYGAMDLFVLPSHREGFPRAAMEAAAMGLPVVATDIRGCREVVVRGENGLLFPPGDVSALTEAILQVGSDHALRTSMGLAARQRAQTHFDERRIVDTVMKAYTEHLDRVGRSWSTVEMRDAALRQARPGEAIRLAQLHASSIQAGFLSRLGIPFLTILYHALIRWRDATVIVAEHGGAIGFVAGVQNTARFYRSFATKWGLLALIAALPRLLSPSVLRRARETLDYGRGNGAVSAELLSMAVDLPARGLGIGRRLGQEFLTRMERASITRVKVVVGAVNGAAIALYESLGFITQRKVEVHAGEASLEMVWSAPE